MKVILTERVKSLGNVGEMVSVSSGFARNFILPNSLGVIADEKNKKIMEDQQRRLQKKMDEERKKAEELQNKVKSLTLEFVRRVGSNGQLFGAINGAEISKELEKRGIIVERRLVVIESPIKQLGEFQIKLKLFAGVESAMKVKVVIDPAQAEENAQKQKLAAERAKNKKKDDEQAPTEVAATDADQDEE